MTIHASQLPHAQALVAKLNGLYALRVAMHSRTAETYLAVMHDKCLEHEPEQVELEEGQADMILMTIVNHIRSELTCMGIATEEPPNVYPVAEERRP